MNVKNKIDVVAKLSPEMKKVVEVQLASAPAEPAETNEQMRQNYEIERKFWNEGGPVMHDSKDVWVEFEGSRVRTRIYYPNLQSEYKTIFFIHGGGWVVGSIDTGRGWQWSAFVRGRKTANFYRSREIGRASCRERV